MNPESSLAWLESQATSFLKALDALKASPGQFSDIHAARLARKRMATALRWVREVAGSLEVKKNLQRTRELFSVMGDLRDLQLMQSRLAAHAERQGASYPAFAAYLQKQLESALGEVQEEVSLFDAEQLEKVLAAARKALKKSGETDFAEAAKAHAARLHKAVLRVANRLDQEKALHRLRRQVREGAFFAQMVEDAGMGPLLTSKQLESNRKVGAQLGEWHDRLIFQETLTRWVKKHTSRKEDDPETALYATLRQIAKQDVADALKLMERKKPTQPKAAAKPVDKKAPSKKAAPKAAPSKKAASKTVKPKASTAKPAPSKAAVAAKKKAAKPVAKA